MNIPQNLFYTKDHEWLKTEGNIATIGITTHAAEQLGDVVFVELPEVGRTLAQGEASAVVESVKAASDVYAPLAGTVIEVNAALAAAPELVNQVAPLDVSSTMCQSRNAPVGNKRTTAAP